MEYPAGWSEEKGRLSRTIDCGNFVDAVAFVDKIVPLAEQAGHHPDIEIFAYKNVRITLSTHDAGNTITEKDLSLAEEINGLLS